MDVREYARQRLREANEADAVARQRCEAWYLALAQAARCGLAGPNQASWLATLDRSAPIWPKRFGPPWSYRPADAAGLAGQIWRFWILKGHLREGRRSLEAVLGAPVADGDRLLTCSGGPPSSFAPPRLPPPRRELTKQSASRCTLDDPALLGEASHLAGLLFLMAGEYRRAVALLDTAISSAYQA